jgi:putative ABC transport system permease protein
MTLADLFENSIGNLWRMKLRAFLTISGVVIAIAAFVAMLSFGTGMQRNVTERFDSLGLFNTIRVYPLEAESESDTTHPNLDQAAIERLSKLPGVQLAYPYDVFDITATLGDSTLNVNAQTAPAAAMAPRVTADLLAGRVVSSDSARELVMGKETVEALGIEQPDSALGRRVILTAQLASMDSGLANAFRQALTDLPAKLRTFDFDSLQDTTYPRSLIREEANEAIGAFLEGYMQHREKVEDTLEIVGVYRSEGGRRNENLLLPPGRARRLGASQVTGDPMQMLEALASGKDFRVLPQHNQVSYPRVTVMLESGADPFAVADTIETMGFRARSFAENFEEVREVFLWFNLALGAIGLVALITASLGIINTMIMSILERRREIGVLKSLGADDSHIRLFFLMESATIGLVGGVVGVAFGWIITRIASEVAQIIMTQRDIPPVDLFALPWWLVLVSLALGLVVSVLAGYYPAVRAARVDPVQALRGD